MSVQITIARAKALDKGQKLAETPALSSNRITGYSVNFPIYQTCQPTKICASNCYAAIPHKPIAMKQALNKQVGLYNLVKEDPYRAADKIIAEMAPRVRKGVKFLRWNGVGDLFQESVECLTHVAESLPNLALWVTTRRAEFASIIPDLKNIFVHFSLDAVSLDRYERLQSLNPISSQIFYSYTEDTNERHPPDALREIPISVYFSDLYRKDIGGEYERASCPLNTATEIKDMCARCGRCWSTDALTIKIYGDSTKKGDQWTLNSY